MLGPGLAWPLGAVRVGGRGHSDSCVNVMGYCSVFADIPMEMCDLGVPAPWVFKGDLDWPLPPDSQIPIESGCGWIAAGNASVCPDTVDSDSGFGGSLRHGIVM